MAKKVIAPVFLKVPDRPLWDSNWEDKMNFIIIPFLLVVGRNRMEVSLFPMSHNSSERDKFLLHSWNMSKDVLMLEKPAVLIPYLSDTIKLFKEQYITESGNMYEDEDIIHLYMTGLTTALTLEEYHSMGFDFGVASTKLGIRWLEQFEGIDSIEWFKKTKFHLRHRILFKGGYHEFEKAKKHYLSSEAYIIQVMPNCYFAGYNSENKIIIQSKLLAKRFKTEDDALNFAENNCSTLGYHGFEIATTYYASYTPTT